MADIFISYSSKHRDLTEKLAALLEKEGYSVWWDYALDSWGSYEAQISAALEGSRVVVVIWSEAAASSDWVYSEAKKANDAHKLVNALPPGLPVSLVRQPFDAHHIDRLDLAEPHRLLRSIRGVWTGKPHASAKALHEHYQEAFGVSLFDPKRTPLDRDGAEPGPAELLQAKHEAVDYMDATGLAEDMLAWCRDGIRATAGRLIHGPGGFGKTRLMIETAFRLRGEYWLAGFLQPPRRPDDIQEVRQRDQALEQVFAVGDEPGVLLVVDYAEGRQPEVAALAMMLAARPRESSRPVRLVLLARGDAWWQDFHKQTEGVERLFRAAGQPLGDVRTVTPIPAGEARRDFFDRSVAGFAPMTAAMARAGLFPTWDGRPPHPDRLRRLMHEPAYGRPLAIQMEAMLHLASAAPEVGTPGVDALLGRVLGLEQAHWQKLLGALDDNRLRDLGRGAAQVTAVQGVDDTAAVERLLLADGFYAGARTARVHVDPVRRDLDRLYGKVGGGIAQLEPDLLGEHLVASVSDVDLIEACLAWIAAEPEADRTRRRRDLLVVLQRVTQPEHGLKANTQASILLDHLVHAHMAVLADDIVAVMTETPGHLDRLVEKALDRLDFFALHALDDALPHIHLQLLELSLKVSQRHMQSARTALKNVRADVGPPEVLEFAQASYASAVGQLAIRLANLGRHEEALAANKEAVSIRRPLAEARPEAFLPGLAKSLNNLSIRFSDLGHRESAVSASREAVANFRRLVESDPEVFLPDLATSLNSHGNDLSQLGRRGEALAATEEAVSIRRQLAESRTDTFLPDLAMSLNNLGVRLSGLGRREAALAASEEAVTINRRLAETKPYAFLPELARSLNNLGIRLADLGRHRDALAASAEAVSIRRRLAEARPEAFLPFLAASLNNLGTRLADLGRHQDGLAASQEGVAITRRLAQTRPEAFLPSLAGSLNNLGNHLSNLGRRQDALAVSQEAVAITRQFVENRPEAFLHDLARSLANLGNRLSDLRRHQDAVATYEEAVGIYRRLVETHREAFLPDLARSLTNLAIRLARSWRFKAALATMSEAMALRREFSVRRPVEKPGARRA